MNKSLVSALAGATVVRVLSPSDELSATATQLTFFNYGGLTAFQKNGAAPWLLFVTDSDMLTMQSIKSAMT